TSHMIFSVSIAVQKCYRSMATNKCKENEIRHFCKYHGKSVERRMDPAEEEVSRCFLMKGDIKTPVWCWGKAQRNSKDFYIEVSPGIYSVTAISEDMVEQTHVVDVNAGQSVDLTFVL
ncbi:AKIP1 protein, partial [Setophaga kirtlandii]|nr:AKIP1 protein [Setophaga kirtlandii]